MARPRGVVPAAALLLPIAAFGCGEGPAPPPATFEAVFREERSLVLEESPDTPLGELTALAVGSGIFAVIDGGAAELRVHDAADGRLVDRPGRAGAGPGELRRPVDVAVRGGVAWVADAGGPDLVGYPIGGGPHRFLAVPGGTAGRVLAAPGGLLVGTSERSEPRLTRIDVADGRVLGRFLREDSAIVAAPYWGAVADHPAAALQDGLVAAFNLRYPLRRFSWDGTADALGSPPPSWRPARMPELGEFAGRDGQVRLVSEYLTSFTTVARIDAFGDGELLVTHGGFERRTAPGVPFAPVQRSVDVYGDAGLKRAEDLALPGRVLAVSGDTLYLVTAEPPAGWTITLFTRSR